MRGKVVRLNKDLITYGKTLIIEADTLIAEDVSIQTFEEGAVAKEGESGRSGGEIFIKAKKATGLITVVLRGENGGQGIKPLDIPEPAPKGRNAKRGKEHCSREPRLLPFGYYEMKKTNNKENPHVFSKLEDESPNLFMCYCMGEKKATNGHKGKKGFKGGQGYEGGNSGSLFVEIEAPSENFELIYEPHVGKGGRSSQGGLGGLGGKGGKADPYGDCPVFKRGKDGERGERGDEGDQGVEGLDEEICIKLGEKQEGSCS